VNSLTLYVFFVIPQLVLGIFKLDKDNNSKNIFFSFFDVVVGKSDMKNIKILNYKIVHMMYLKNRRMECTL